MRIPKELLDLAVTLQLTRASSTSDALDFRLEVTDFASRQIVLIADFDAETFADLLSARGGTRTARARVNVGPRLGKRHESQAIYVPISDEQRSSGWSDPLVLEVVRQSAEDIAGDGWIADRGEGWNSHRVGGSRGAHTYAVTVRRWV
jgi:hypothetical protein